MKLIVTGITGRMGRIISQEILNNPKLELIGVTVRNSNLIGKDVGDILGQPKTGVTALHLSDCNFSHANAIIDFTLPEGLPAFLDKAIKHTVPIVLGMTGLNLEQEAALNAAAKHIPIVHSNNMSVGVNVLAALIEKAAETLKNDFDIEISELHHKHKIDAPSGTALLLGEAAAEGRNVNLKDVQVHSRAGKRKTGDIGFSVQRGGGVIGDHHVLFIGENERIELNHRAHNRSIYADGAIRAAQWLQDKPAGRYSMRDVLDI